MKNLLFILIFIFSLISCSTEDDSGKIIPTTQQPDAEPENTPVKQYTLSLTANEGGSVTNGGTYDEGTSVSIIATPSRGI